MRKLRNGLRIIVINIYMYIYKLYGMHIHESARIFYGAKLDKTNPKGVYIDQQSYVASGAIIFTHDFSRKIHKDTHIGKRCFIGANAIIMCGVKIGDEVVVGSAAVVT